jgi:hypothetical protein
MTTLDDLLNNIFDGKRPALYTEFEGWVRTSRRFKAFATSYRGKIRTKLKSVRDEAGMKDVRAEFETASVLLREDRFTLEYEKYAVLKQRGPDYTVTFKTHTPFNVEVRRVRNSELQEGDAEAHIVKLMHVLCDKVGQMPPSIVNLLWLTAEQEIPEENLIQANKILRQLAENKVEEFFTRRGFDNAADFLKQYRQLSGIVLHRTGTNVVWLNSLARHKAPPDIVLAIHRLETNP